ncbi:MAG: hypothetical protein K0V04_36030 [Deltaproteobacteria bacterium]|nr:hypothetical protein [Deltaproteobacteria bacterium]
MTRPQAMWGWLALVPLMAVYPACGDDGGTQTSSSPPPPADTGSVNADSTTGPDPGTTTAGIGCPCAADQFCAADYAVGDPEPDPSVFTCRDACVPLGAVALWCSDDTSCCEGSCRTDGLCGDPIPATDSGTGSSSGSGGSGGSMGSGSSMGTSSGGSSDGGSTSSGGSSST